MSIRRTTVAALSDDLALLEAEARRRGISLGRLLGEIVGREANRLRRRTRPRLGIVRGTGDATRRIAEDEHEPARPDERS